MMAQLWSATAVSSNHGSDSNDEDTEARTADGDADVLAQRMDRRAVSRQQSRRRHSSRIAAGHFLDPSWRAAPARVGIPFQHFLRQHLFRFRLRPSPSHRLMMPLMPPRQHALLAMGFQQGHRSGTLLITASEPNNPLHEMTDDERKAEFQAWAKGEPRHQIPPPAWLTPNR